MSIPAQFQSGFTRHRYALAAGVIVLFVFIWMVTCGTFDLFDQDFLGQFYDAQAKSLSAGRWDVPNEAIWPEEYHRDGKSYGYYGFMPALPRMMLNRLFPGMWGSWSRLSVTLACGVTLSYCYLLFLRVRVSGSETGNPPGTVASAGFVMLAGLGSTTIFLGSCAFVHHEAMIWAVALALACYYHLLGYLTEGRWTQLLLAGGLSYLSFFCRISTGCGPCLAILLAGLNVLAWNAPPRFTSLAGVRWLRCLNGWSKPPPLAQAATAALTLLVIFTTYVAINRAKFGTLVDAAPMRFYSQMVNDPVRWEKAGGQWMRLGNVPTVAWAYLSPCSIDVEKTFPWVFLQETLRKFAGQHMAGNGPFSSVTIAMPLFLALALVGLVSLALGQRPHTKITARGGASPVLLLIGSLGSIIPILPFFTVDNRYLHEFFPFLILGAALALPRAAALRSRRAKMVIKVALIVIGTYQIYVNCSLALVYQRLMVYCRKVGPEVEMRHWQRSIDHFVARCGY